MSIPLVHPRRSTKFRGKDHLGETNPSKQESRFVRCQWCGAINDKLKRPKGDGWGGNISYDSISGTNLKQPTVGGAGCWACGSSNGW